LRTGENHYQKAGRQKRIPAEKVRLPSDRLTQKQLNALNGPVIIVRPAKPLNG
jgi:hypothetical protein